MNESPDESELTHNASSTDGEGSASRGEPSGSSALEAGDDGQTPPPAQRPSRTVRVVAEPGDMSKESASPTSQTVDPLVTPSTPKPPTTEGHKSRPDLRREEVLKGSHPGDQFIRYSRQAGPFRRQGRNVLTASIETEAPRSPIGRLLAPVKRVLIGAPISSEHAMHERLTNVKALAILSSDPLSSVAYATEEIFRILLVAGTSALWYATPLALAITALMVIVVASYRQTILAYPRGGGTYIVAKDNLGVVPGLSAASFILIGYILTVAVSVAAGVAALYSLFPDWKPYRVEICIGLVIFITITNLRGIREAGNIFALPTYLFIVGMLGLLIYGFLRVYLGVGGMPVYEAPPETMEIGTGGGYEGFVLVLLLLRAFTQGCAALTGVEAIADGVPAFKPPEAKNARLTLVWMAVVAITLFVGITLLATSLKVLPSEDETVVSQIARTVFGENFLWYFIQVATALILILAANTAYADFPRLAYFMARDKFMPHQYAFRGDRLAFSWGIITLAVFACILIILFGGDTSSLIPLYAVGVFGAFTMSQSGMVVRWWRQRPPGWGRNFAMNLVGALTTFLVLAVATLTKLESGTWIVLAIIPFLIAIFMAINRHYTRVSTEVEATTPTKVESYKHTFIVPVGSLNGVALSAIAYARSLSSNVTAVHIVEGEEEGEAEQFNQRWKELLPDTDVNLVVIESPYRSLIGPLLSYIDALDQQSPDDTITIILAESIPAKPWEYLLHNQSALRLKASLLFRPNTVVADVPYLLGRNRQRVARPFYATFPWVPLLILIVVLYLVYRYIFP